MGEQLEQLLQRCTVKLSIPDHMNWGTGFFVAPGLIVTCYHVVKDAKNEIVQVCWQNQEDFAEAIIECSLPEFDLALLRFNPPVTDLDCVYLDESVKSRDNLYTYGYPDDFSRGAPVIGECRGLTGDEPPLILFRAAQVRPGLSGSPLLNQRTGKVCGIVKFTLDRSSELGGGAVPTSVILSQFPELKELQQEHHQQALRWTNLLPKHPPNKKRAELLEAVRNDVSSYVSQKLKDLLIKPQLKESLSHPKPKPINLLLEECPQKVKKRNRLPGARLEERSSKELINIFNQEDIQGKLLILGEPGSGKTLMLLQLAKDLLKQADEDQTLPIPVLFDLVTWKKDKQTIKEWLIEQLFEKYHLEEKDSEQFLKKRQLLLLLDGLDMLGLKRQIKCVEAINNFIKGSETYQLLLVVCCRLEEYDAGVKVSGEKLDLNGAICLKSLTYEQIEQYLEDLGVSSWEIIQKKPALKKLAKTPLFLIMMLRSRKEELEIINNQDELFKTYIETKLDEDIQTKKSPKKLSRSFNNYQNFKEKQKKKYFTWLAWLANKMKNTKSPSAFFIDQMQLDLLDKPGQTWSYSIGIGIIIGFIYGIIFGLIYILKRGTSEGITVGLITWLVTSFISTLPLVLLFQFRLIKSSWNKQKQVIYSLGIGSAFFLIFFLLFQLFISLPKALIIALMAGLMGANNDAKLKGAQGRAFDNIIPVRNRRSIDFNKKEDRKKMINVLSLYIFWLTILGLFFGILNALDRSLIFWLISGWICAIVFGIGNLIKSSEIKIEMEMIPNQGIWESAKSASRFTLAGVLLLGLMTRIANLPILWAIVASLYIGLYRGGNICIQHFILRLVLYLSGEIPWDYARFLDEAEKRRLIIKVGGSYRFLHPLLQDYFAKRLNE